MNLRDVSYAMRAVADVAHAGEGLLASLDRSRRRSAMPLLLGVALGVGIGAVVFRKETRERALQWLGLTVAPPRGANGATAEPRVAAAAAVQP